MEDSPSLLMRVAFITEELEPLAALNIRGRSSDSCVEMEVVSGVQMKTTRLD